MSEQADIEAALARATAAYKNVRAERDALKDDRAERAEAEIDRLREALMAIVDLSAPSGLEDARAIAARAALAKEEEEK